VWPHDLDLWSHVNGGRYLALSDLGRLDFTVLTGGPRICTDLDDDGRTLDELRRWGWVSG
jgi:hypothetical protein